MKINGAAAAFAVREGTSLHLGHRWKIQMAESIKRYQAVCIACLLLLAVFALGGCVATDGRSEAERDIAAGRLVLCTYGLPTAWRSEYSKQLEERLGVQLKVVAGCLVTEELVEHTDAYNAVMEAEIERRFGEGILEKVRTDSIQTWMKHVDLTELPDYSEQEQIQQLQELGEPSDESISLPTDE